MLRHRANYRYLGNTLFFLPTLRHYQVYTPTQTFGNELIDNGDMSDWTGDNLDVWSLSGESGSNPEVTQRSPTQTNADTPAGLGAANFFSTTNTQPRIQQTILTPDLIYEINTTLTARVSGNFAFTGFVNAGSNNFITVGGIRLTKRATSTANFIIQPGTQPTNLTIDDVSVRQVNLNPAYTVPTNTIIDFFFNPTSIRGEEEVTLQYRIPTLGDELLNGYIVYLQRRTGNTNWNMNWARLDNGSRVPKSSVSSVGASTTGLRIRTVGNDHTVYSWSEGVLTPRGTFTDATYNTATLANVIYPSDVITPQVVIYS